MTLIRWGILGAGKIAGALVAGIREAGGEVRAVGSRSGERAAEFADRFGIPASYGSYEALLADDGVDAVYIATTNELHHANTLNAITAGKAVLCEKPLALNSRQAGEMAEAARRDGVFLMEAMWTRFIPSTVALLEMVERGDLGDIQAVTADFGFRSDAGPTHRLVDPALGGGALLDLGVYPITLAMLLLGEPTGIAARAGIGPSGVDEQIAAVLSFPGGALATLYATFLAATTVEAQVVGTEARATLRSRFHNSEQIDVTGPDGVTISQHYPLNGSGYRFEVEEVHRALGASETESPLRTLDESLAVMGVMDTIRSQVGVRYPGE